MQEQEAIEYSEVKKRLLDGRKMPDLTYEEVDELVAKEQERHAKAFKKEHQKALVRKAKKAGAAPETTITLRTVSHEEDDSNDVTVEKGDCQEHHAHDEKSQEAKITEDLRRIHKVKTEEEPIKAQEDKLVKNVKLSPEEIEKQKKELRHVLKMVTKPPEEVDGKAAKAFQALHESRSGERVREMELVLAIKRQDTFAFILAQITGFLAGLGAVEVVKMLYNLLCGSFHSAAVVAVVSQA